MPKVRFDEENRWWKLVKALTAAAVEWGRGKFFVELIDCIQAAMLSPP